MAYAKPVKLTMKNAPYIMTEELTALRQVQLHLGVMVRKAKQGKPLNGSFHLKGAGRAVLRLFKDGARKITPRRSMRQTFAEPGLDGS